MATIRTILFGSYGSHSKRYLPYSWRLPKGHILGVRLYPNRQYHIYGEISLRVSRCIEEHGGGTGCDTSFPCYRHPGLCIRDDVRERAVNRGLWGRNLTRQNTTEILGKHPDFDVAQENWWENSTNSSESELRSGRGQLPPKKRIVAQIGNAPGALRGGDLSTAPRFARCLFNVGKHVNYGWRKLWL